MENFKILNKIWETKFTIITGVLLGGFLSFFLNKKYYNNMNIFFFINAFTIFIFIGKHYLVEEIGYFYNCLISEKNELLLTIILVTLSFLLNFNFSYDFLIIKIGCIVILFSFFYYIFKPNIDNVKIKEDKEDILFSFRKKEFDYLKTLVEDRNISTILIDDKIGNGKTFLLEYFLNKCSNNYEVIYLKLPLLKNCEILKKVVMNEIFIILKKNKIPLKKMDLFFQKVSSIKTNLFELNLSAARSNWDSLKELKIGIHKLEQNNKMKGKQILIILDDIEREDNKNKIKDSIIFLGELSEYLKDTNTTFIFLAQYKEIIELENNKINLFEKYFNQKIRLSSLKFENLKKEDLKILIEKCLKITLDEKKLETNIIFILSLLKNLKTEMNELKLELETIYKNKKIPFKTESNENFRTLVRYLTFFKKNMTDEKLENNSILIWIYIYKSFEVFFQNFNHLIIKNKEIAENIYNNLRDDLKGNIDLLDISEIENIKKYAEGLYINGGLKGDENINCNLELIFEYLNGSKIEITDIRKELNSSEYISLFERINPKSVTKETISNLFDLELKFSDKIVLSKDLISLITNVNDINFLTEKQLNYFFNILIKEIENNKFYTLTYTYNNDTEYQDEEKINKLKLFKNILIKSNSNLNFHVILNAIEKHIKNPSLNSESEEELRYQNQEEE